MMNILSITNSGLDPRSGSGKTVLHYTSGLRDIGHAVEVFEPKDYVLWPRLRRANKLRLAGGAWPLLRARSRGVDLVEFYGDEFGASIWRLSTRKVRPLLVAHTNGLELLATARERAEPPPASRSMAGGAYRRAVQKSHDLFSTLAFANADCFVALCDLDRNHVLELGYYPPEYAAIVEPGLDPEYLAVPWDSPREERVVFTGSWIARKGVGALASVMTRVMTERATVRLDVFGAGASAETVHAAFPEPLRARIAVHRRLPEREIARSLGSAKVFFFPTQYEGFGIALSEAMACGCAAVTTPTGFGAELADGEEALLCGFDDVERMKTSIDRLLDDDTLRRRIARGGWARTRSLTWEANIQKLDALYRRWVAAPPPRRRD